MHNDDRLEIEEAVDHVCHWLSGDGCVLFLGAAFSGREEGDEEGEGVPSGTELLNVLNSKHNSQYRTLASALEAKYGHGPRGMLARFLAEQFKGAKPTIGHHLAARLPFRTVITTNCDDLDGVSILKYLERRDHRCA